MMSPGITLAAALLLSACTTSALMVEQAPAPYRADGARLEALPPTMPVSDDIAGYVRTKMEEKLVGGPKAVFASGTALTIRYQLLGHAGGSRVARFLTSGAAGASKTYIQAEFVDPAGTVVGKVRAEGSASDDFFTGGSAKSGIDSAVKQIADYAATNFR